MSTSSAELSSLSYAKYGKTAVRVFRIVREGKWHHIVEYNVTVLLEGEIETSLPSPSQGPLVVGMMSHGHVKAWDEITGAWVQTESMGCGQRFLCRWTDGAWLITVTPKPTTLSSLPQIPVRSPSLSPALTFNPWPSPLLNHLVVQNLPFLLLGVVKNITYYLAKVSPHILSAERFALHLGTFFVSKYDHITKAHANIEQLRWARIEVPGEQKEVEEHSHAFWRDGEEKRIVSVVVDATAGKDKLIASVTAGISGLLVLKSTGSTFEGFVKDEFTTLVPVDDRIFSTSIDLTYTFKPFAVAAPRDDKKLEFEVPIQSGAEGYSGSVWDESVPVKARKATLEVFAVDESASVQVSNSKPLPWVIPSVPFFFRFFRNLSSICSF
ncbi:hypothetical protein D9756_002890 [Leucocoprinus leucothites]|uniref:factor independent urate hydroxylase n=1 Tax=Leucocoprinus leucothites TaxID=201217 RepID=A0A8H5G766_9AGAR|nr:hypothetical protein D9756_002890 [Leucoagaricus leucothites]